MDQGPTFKYLTYNEMSFTVFMNLVDEVLHDHVCDHMNTFWAREELEARKQCEAEGREWTGIPKCVLRKGYGSGFHNQPTAVYWIAFDFQSVSETRREYTKEQQKFAELLFATFCYLYPDGNVVGTEALAILHNHSS